MANPNLGPPSNTTGSNPSNDTGIAQSNACFSSKNAATDCGPAISQNKSIPLSYPGRPVRLSWGNVGEPVGPNNSYVTSRSPLADAPRYAMFVSQLNATYVPLTNISGNTAACIQPNMSTFAGDPRQWNHVLGYHLAKPIRCSIQPQHGQPVCLRRTSSLPGRLR